MSCLCIMSTCWAFPFWTKHAFLVLNQIFYIKCVCVSTTELKNLLPPTPIKVIQQQWITLPLPTPPLLLRPPPITPSPSPTPNCSGLRSIQATTMASTPPTNSVWSPTTTRFFCHHPWHRIHDSALWSSPRLGKSSSVGIGLQLTICPKSCGVQIIAS